TKVTGIMQVFLDLGDKLRQVAKSFIHEDPIQIPVAVLLEEVKERFRDLQPPHRLDIDPIAQPCRVKVNRSQIVDILVNLIDNACKAMKEGGAITIRTEAESRHVRLAVSDSGEGIDSSLHEKIFRLFYSATGSSGFGLWSAQFKAELNGGILEVRSTRGQGATFILTLPRDDQPLEVEFGGQ
ncbi:MAG TPA: HAMP domain-containing sensor histidine kinase, partial [Thermoanaerobaculia bacterium]|nr:HAMP domain-containing sensor histidine kinase [Thermoanaerobaculia bacterium]